MWSAFSSDSVPSRGIVGAPLVDSLRINRDFLTLMSDDGVAEATDPALVCRVLTSTYAAPAAPSIAYERSAICMVVANAFAGMGACSQKRRARSVYVVKSSH